MVSQCMIKNPSNSKQIPQGIQSWALSPCAPWHEAVESDAIVKGGHRSHKVEATICGVGGEELKRAMFSGGCKVGSLEGQAD